MNKTIKTIFSILIFLCITIPTNGQNLEKTLEKLMKANAKGYLGPVVTAFGTGVNSGVFHTAKPHKILGFDITANISFTSISDNGLEYEFFIPDEVTLPFKVKNNDLGIDTTFNILFDGQQLYPGDRKSSTFFGEKTSNKIMPDTEYALSNIRDKLGQSLDQSIVDQLTADIDAAINEKLPINTPKGYNIPGIPMIMPQVSIGLPLHIELTLRGAPPIKLPDDAGKLSFFGYGGKIGLNQFIPIPLFPIKVSAGYYMTNLQVGDVLEANNSIITFQASKSIPFLTVYGGFGLESSSLDVNYNAILDPDNPTDITKINFSLDGENSFRTIVGLRLKLFLLSINADYNIGEYPAFNLGIGFTFR